MSPTTRIRRLPDNSGINGLNSTKQIFKVDRREIHFLRFTLESYDGMALVSTIDPHSALIEVSMAPGCETLVLELIDALKKDEGLRISNPR